MVAKKENSSTISQNVDDSGDNGIEQSVPHHKGSSKLKKVISQLLSTNGNKMAIFTHVNIAYLPTVEHLEPMKPGSFSWQTAVIKAIQAAVKGCRVYGNRNIFDTTETLSSFSFSFWLDKKKNIVVIVLL